MLSGTISRQSIISAYDYIRVALKTLPKQRRPIRYTSRENRVQGYFVKNPNISEYYTFGNNADFNDRITPVF